MIEPRAGLLAAAAELFPTQGFSKTTVQQLTDHAGISKGAFYLHFRSKTELMTALIHDLQSSLLEQVAAIARDESLSPRQRFRDQVIFQFADVLEKRLLLEAYLKDAGLELDEELALLAQRARVDWQRLQEDFLRLAFPDHDSRFTTDLAILVNGALNEYSSYVILENLDLDPERVADLVSALVESFIEHLAAVELEPVMESDQLLDREVITARLQEAERLRIDEALAELEELVEGLDPDDAADARETIEALRDCLAEEEPRRAILQGLLANLREWRELATPRRDLAHELGLKLV